MENKNSIQEKIDALGSDTIMGAALNKEMNESIDKLQEAIDENNAQEEAVSEDVSKTAITGNNLNNVGYYQRIRPLVRDYKKIGRNDPCPCGSGDKYKNCCLDSGKYETLHYE